jgi:hypothetical protein
MVNTSELPKVVIAAGLFMATAVQPLAAQGITCAEGETLTPVSGKIFNNAVQAGTTLGTVHFTLGPARTGKKMKCGLLGLGGSGDASLNFVHTLVCDDQVVFPTGDIVHSQLTLTTTGTISAQPCLSPPFPPGSITGAFTETSVPNPQIPGRGVFAGVERGVIQIQGTINCLFTIDMEFSGAVCLKNSQ